MIDLEGKINDKRIYSIWEGMKSRCCNPKSQLYHRYGGRGITICDEWKNNSRAFIKWAYENGYDENACKKECELDRIDNNKGYCPENCHFVNHKLNARNMERCHIVEYNGEKRHWLEWCEILDISKKSIEHLVERYKLTYAEAFDRKLYYKYNPHNWSWELK